MAENINLVSNIVCENHFQIYLKDDYVFKTYKIGFPKCKQQLSLHNCNNPHCLSIVEQLYMDVELKLKRRRANSFVGLKNLGATCYVNSLLQLWFHNINIRNAILSWDPTDDENEKQNHTLFIENAYEPMTEIGHLQLVFALMQSGNQQTVNPEQFIKCFNIDVTIEEDAEEFSNFLLTLFHDKLESQSNVSVREILKDNFFGVYNSVITCSTCKTKSVTTSQFRELCLNIKGHRTLNNSLQEYFEKEKMIGDEKYFCEQCKTKQNAIRQIFLTSLPNLLNLKLMRYVYDSKLMTTRKLNTEISCPYTIDMEKYLDWESSNGNNVYHLYGVLIHKGTNSNVGHYMTHIKDVRTGEWYEFDDEKVKKLTTYDLNLNTDNKISKGLTSKEPINIRKNEYQTNNAYMLVYMRASVVVKLKTEQPKCTLSPRLTQLVNTLNNDYEKNLLKEIQNRESALILSNLIREIRSTEVKEDEGDAISLQWLISFMETAPDETVDEIDNEPITCPHNKLNPNALHLTKYIGTKLADKLYDLYQGGPRLRLNLSLCELCVRNRYSLLYMGNLTGTHNQLICNNQKLAYTNNYSEVKNNEPSYWVGKESFECWQQKYLKIFQHFLKFNDILPDLTIPIDNEILAAACESLIGILDENLVKESIKEENNETNDMESTLFEPDCDISEYDSERDNLEEYLELLEHKRLNKTLISDTDINSLDLIYETNHVIWTFNEDITCPHGNLSIAKDTMRLIPEKVKNIFQIFFPEVKFFVKNTEPCGLCKAHYKIYIQRNLQSMSAVLQEKFLNTLLFDDTRPDYPQENCPYFCITKKFFKSWQQFVGSPSTEPRPQLIDNKSLLCKDHNELLFEPTSNFVPTNQRESVIITKKEWLNLIDYYQADYGVFVYFDKKGKYQKSIPKVCQICIQTPGEERNQFKDYINAKIYIQYTINNFKCYETDSEDEVLGKCIKKFKQNVPSTNDIRAASAINIYNGTSDHRTKTKEKQISQNQIITMSSNDTVFLLKEKIEKLFNVAPVNQILKTASGKPLIDNRAKLRDLKIYPESVIIAEFINENLTKNVAQRNWI